MHLLPSGEEQPMVVFGLNEEGDPTMTTPATYNIVTYQGDDDSFVLTYTIGGVIANLTGYSAQMDVRTRRNASTAIASFSSPSNGISIDGPNGKITVSLPHAITGVLAPADYVYDLQITSPSGLVTTVVQGLFSIVQEVTHV